MNKKHKYFFLSGASYTPIAISSPPEFSDTFTLNAAVQLNSIETTEISGKRDLLVPTTYADRLRPNNFQGTSGSPYRLKSISDSTRSWVGGDLVTASQQVFGMLNSPTYVYLYHLGFTGNTNPAVAGITGMQFTAKTPGSVFIASDIVVKDVNFAGFQINSTSGEVENISFNFCRVFGYNVEGEGFYLGNTSKVDGGYAWINNCTLQDVFVYNKGRDGFQFNNHRNLYVNRATAFEVGVTSTASQQSLVQVQNTFGLIENSIFWDAPEFGTIDTHGITFRNCVFKATSRGFINRMATNYLVSEVLDSTLSIRFENCHFQADSEIAEYWRIQEDQVDVEFINCTKSHAGTNLYLDFRSDTVTCDIIETGTTTLGILETPSFNSLDPLNDEAGLITTSYYLNRGVGYRTN